MAQECLRARELLGDVGISAEVIDPVTLVPLDLDTIAASVRRTGHLLVVDNGWTCCGAGAEIIAGMVERLGDERPAMRRMGFAPATCPTTPWLEQEFYPNPVTIAEAAHALLRPRAPAWQPSAEHAKLAYQLQFRGPF
jgi:pyruvate dehydrogenase E1 component beta subunit